MTEEQIAKAMRDPEGSFGTPENIVAAANLSNETKIELLRRWQYNACEEAVALEEGMPGEESDMLQRILTALGELAGPLDLEQTGPAKQHGLPREAIKKHT